MTEIKKTRSIGLKKVLFGPVNKSGGMSSDLKQLGKTYKGTASFNTEADNTQDFYSEESPNAPEESVSTEAGLKQIKLNLMEWDNASLAELFGGEVKQATVNIDGKIYKVEKFVAPRDMVTIEMCVRAISRYNVVVDIPRALITARFVWNMTQTDIAQIEITAKAQAPLGDEDGAYEVYKLGEPQEVAPPDPTAE